MAAITLDKVEVAFNGKTVLDRLTIELAPTGVTALIGPNGAGKSVTLRVIRSFQSGIWLWTGQPCGPWQKGMPQSMQ
ncbi:ATP-binding cassette domain-containing protein, partial [Hansschlegelia beijingensis]